MTTWRTELSAAAVSGAVVLPAAYGFIGIHPLAGALSLVIARGVSEVSQDVFRSLANLFRLNLHTNVIEAVRYLGYYGGGTIFSNYLIKKLALAAIPLPVSLGMLTASILVINFVRYKLAPMPLVSLTKEITEEFVFRPANGAACAALSAHVLTNIAPMSAALMGGLTFLAARIGVFVLDKLAENHKDREFFQWMGLVGGALAGWHLSVLALPYFGFAPIPWKMILLGGVGAMIPAAAIWGGETGSWGFRHVSEAFFRKHGWNPPPKKETPIVLTPNRPSPGIIVYGEN